MAKLIPMKWLIFFILTLAASALYFRYGLSPNKNNVVNSPKNESPEPDSLDQPQNLPRTELPSRLSQPPTEDTANGLPQPQLEPNTIPPATVEVPPQVPPSGSNDFQSSFPQQPNFQPPFESPPPSQVFPESEVPPPPSFFPENDSFNEVPPVDSPNAFDPPPYINNDNSNNGYVPPPPPPPTDQESF
jgi:hypothetical protein